MPHPVSLRRRAQFAACAAFGLALAARGLAAENAKRPPPPEAATEVWSPIPPVVSAPADGVPSDAIVLFDGHNLDAWESSRENGALWTVADGTLVVPSGRPGDLQTKRAFGDVQLHIEWRAPAEVKGEGQGRGNSGVFFMGLYELQILDSFNNPTYVNGQAGAIYKEHAPLANASRPPGEWQTFDAVFIAPRFAADGTLASPARLTAFHNGVLVQHDVAFVGPTPNGADPKMRVPRADTFHQAALPPYHAHAPKLPLLLQDHLSPVAFRNIWIRELDLPHEK
ncbi:MAG TPA: DUF1080 domain-containing protein [Opitutaceae bacterium]|nr:DUF1080 domain-containing protein [Opitutaceae bacterium]